jgi:hypothetical protein
LCKAWDLTTFEDRQRQFYKKITGGTYCKVPSRLPYW